MKLRSRCCTVVLFLTALLMTSAPLYSQVDLAGQWASRMHEDQLERSPGPKPGEYQGLPINDAARMRGDSWTASLWTVPEHQCIPHPADYGPNFSSLRIWKDVDPVTHVPVAWHTEFAWMNVVRTIWMDGRPHPPEYAAHTWQGFSTGVWEGDMLTVTTTHLKPAYLRRNGLARSEKATVREHFIRNGDILTIITIITDPVYLTEPDIRSRNFYFDPGFQIPVYPCTIETEVERPEGVIPHFLPGQNPDLVEFAAEHHLPIDAVRGGAETMYPEYMSKIRSLPSAKVSNEAVVPAGSAAVQPRNQQDGNVGILRVRDNVYMLVGPAGNATAQIGKDGVLVVDTMTAAAADKLLAAIRTLSDKPIRWIINTSITADHTGGNAILEAAGQHLEGDRGASIRAYGTVLQRMMSGSKGPNAVPLDLFPTDVYVGEQWDTFVNGEPVQILHQPAAHTDGDSLVMFRRSDVISTGDLFTPDRYPRIDLQNGGSINGLLAGLNHILKLTVPEFNQEGGTMVIPGHGHLCDEADVADYRDMVTIVRNRVQNMVNKHMTLDQVRAAHLTRDYDGIYASPEYTGDMFVETVYRSLAQPVNTLPRSK